MSILINLTWFSINFGQKFKLNKSSMPLSLIICSIQKAIVRKFLIIHLVKRSDFVVTLMKNSIMSEF